MKGLVAELEQRFGHLLLHMQPMHARQARTIESRVSQIQGVLDAAISPAGVLRIEFDRQITDDSTLGSQLQAIGVRNVEFVQERKPVEPEKAGAKPCKKDHDHHHGGAFGENSELVFAAICGGLLLVGWLLSTTTLSSWIPSHSCNELFAECTDPEGDMAFSQPDHVF